MRLPTQEEISPTPEDLDGQWAVTNFLGKSLDEAEAMFHGDSGRYSEDLMHMGPVAFRFYIRAAIIYLRSELPNAHPPMIFGFAGILESRLEFEPQELIPVAGELADICREYLDKYTRFNGIKEMLDELRSWPEWPYIGSINMTEFADNPKDLRVQFTELHEAFSRMATQS